MTPSPNTERFEKLARFLESTMDDPKASRRIRFAAAERLHTLLARQERKQDAEARREERIAVRAAKELRGASHERKLTPPEEPEDVRLIQAREHVAELIRRGASQAER